MYEGRPMITPLRWQVEQYKFPKHDNMTYSTLPLTQQSQTFFMVAPCINIIKYFIVQLMHSIIKIAGLLKHIKI